MEEIMAIARKMEEQQISAEPVETVPLEVGCFGVEGSYSHKAMEEYFAGKNINRHYYSFCRLKILPLVALRKFMTLCAAITAILPVKNA